MYHTADWVRAVGPFFVGIVALLIALFRDDYLRWRAHPELRLAASNQIPHCVFNTHLSVGANSVERPHYSLRIEIENCGNAEAKNVEVFVKSLQRQRGRGNFESVTDFLGTYLSWSGLEEKEKRVLGVLNPEMPKYCYLGRVYSKQGVPASFHSDIPAPAEDYLGDVTFLDFPPPVGSGRRQRFGAGNYRLTVRIEAANAKPIERVARLNVTGRWPGVEPQRVSEVLGFGIVSS